MVSTLVVQAVISGVVNGCIYALIGLGLAVIFKGTRVVNAMQGEFAVIGAMVTVFALTHAGLPYAVAILCGIAVGALIGAVIYAFLVRKMEDRNASEESYLVLTIGLAFALSAAVLYFGGRDSHLLPAFGGDVIFQVFGGFIRGHGIWLVIITLLTVYAIRLFYRKTMLGLSMMAASLDVDGATTTGINVHYMRLLTFALGGGVGAMAGILATPLVEVNFTMGLVFTLKGFAASIIGGLTNPLGAVFGGITLGLLESLAVVGFPSGYKDVVALSLLIIIMIIMPHGMLGRTGRKGG